MIQLIIRGTKNDRFFYNRLILSFFAMGQAPASRVVNAVMPNGSIQLTKEQLKAYLDDNYKRPGIPSDKDNIYLFDRVLISFWDLSINPESKKDLRSSQSEMLGALRLVDNLVIINSQIISVKNAQFLVYEYQIDDQVSIRFQSEYNKNNENICGIIQFKKPDANKAHKALDEFLENVHFKE